MVEKRYIAVIGDIVGSRQIGRQERFEVQERLRRVLAEVTKTYADAVVSPFMITLGDEFQGLLDGGRHLMRVLFRIQSELYPVQIRFGIGAGTMATKIDTTSALGSDGPAYHRARTALSKLKDKDHRIKRTAERTALEDPDFPMQTELVNTVLMMMGEIESRWSERNIRYVAASLGTGRTQSDVAAVFGVGQSTVQKGLVAARYYAYEQAFVTLEHVFCSIV
ncbi:MAG: SatD family protein [Sphaerochaetaceae bacterium]|jgi:transposase